MDEPQMLVFGPRVRGRPRSQTEPLVSVGTRVTASDHDRIVKMAAAERISVSKFLRQVLTEKSKTSQ